MARQDRLETLKKKRATVLKKLREAKSEARKVMRKVNVLEGKNVELFIRIEHMERIRGDMMISKADFLDKATKHMVDKAVLDRQMASVSWQKRFHRSVEYFGALREYPWGLDYWRQSNEYRNAFVAFLTRKKSKPVVEVSVKIGRLKVRLKKKLAEVWALEDQIKGLKKGVKR